MNAPFAARALALAAVVVVTVASAIAQTQERRTEIASPAVRYEAFSAALAAKRWDEAIALADEAFAAGEYEYAYAVALTTNGLADLTARGTASPLVGRVGPWGERAARYVESGRVAEGADPAQWERDKPRTLAILYKAQGVDRFLQIAASRPDGPEAFSPAVTLLTKSASFDDTDPIVYYYLAQAFNAEYAAYARQYDALPEADKTGARGAALLEKTNRASERVLEAYEKVAGRTGPNGPLRRHLPGLTDPPRPVDPNKPDG